MNCRRPRDDRCDRRGAQQPLERRRARRLGEAERALAHVVPRGRAREEQLARATLAQRRRLDRRHRLLGRSRMIGRSAAGRGRGRARRRAARARRAGALLARGAGGSGGGRGRTRRAARAARTAASRALAAAADRGSLLCKVTAHHGRRAPLAAQLVRRLVHGLLGLGPLRLLLLGELLPRRVLRAPLGGLPREPSATRASVGAARPSARRVGARARDRAASRREGAARAEERGWRRHDAPAPAERAGPAAHRRAPERPTS